MILARASESTAALKLDPEGMVTRTVPSFDEPQPAPVATRAAATTGIQRLTSKRERMLQKDGGRERVDIPASAASGPAELADSAKRYGGSVALVHETHGQAGPFLELGRNVADFRRTWRIVAVSVERQADHIPLDLERFPAPDHLRNRRSLPPPTLDEPGRRCDCAGRIAHGETNTAVAIVNRQQARRE
jgi:hypothetical protein